MTASTQSRPYSSHKAASRAAPSRVAPTCPRRSPITRSGVRLLSRMMSSTAPSMPSAVW
jgi:hypothetical protein